MSRRKRRSLRPATVDLFLPSFSSITAEVRRLNVENRYDLNFWRTMMWAYTATL